MSATSNARWVALSQGSRILAQLVSMTVLARMLSPADYGLIAMAAVITNLAYLFRDFGTAAAIIQKENLSETAKTSTFWLNVLIGFLLFGVIVAVAPLVAAYFREPKLVPVLSLLALAFPLSSSALVHQALMERESRFRVVATIEFFATLAGLIAALAAAWAGAGVYSLVIQVLTVASLSAITLWTLSGWRPALSWRSPDVGALLRFSGNVSFFNFVNYFSRNADGMVIGRFLGSIPLGIYSMAYRIMLFPVQNMTYVASRALYPVLSRRQTEPEAAGRSYRKSLGLIAFVAAPVMAGLFVLRDSFVIVVFGNGWSGVAEILAWFAPIGFLQAIVSSTGVVFMSFGRVRLMMMLGVASAVLQVAAFYYGVRFGIEGVAALYLLVNLINAVPNLWFVSRILRIDFVDLYKGVLVCALCAVAMALFVIAVDLGIAWDPSHWWRLITGIVAGAAAYAALAYFFMRDECRNVWTLIAR